MDRDFFRTIRRWLISFPGEPRDMRMSAVGKGLVVAVLMGALLGVCVVLAVPRVDIPSTDVAGVGVWIMSIAAGIWTAKRNWPPAGEGDNLRLRFTIRDLLWLMVVVALAVGWWLDRRPPRYEWIEFHGVHEVESGYIRDNATGDMYELGERIERLPSPANLK